MSDNTLSSELRELKDRIVRIEQKLGIVSKEVSRESPPSAQAVKSHALPPPINVNVIKSEKPTSKSVNLLGAVGVLFFILAASFFIKLAIDSGWLTPIRQLGGAYLFGILLIVFGFNLRAKDREYASLLPAAGLVVLFMSAYAGHLHYELYGSTQAVFIAGAISLVSLYLFTFFASDLYLLVSVAGTYLVPFLIHDVSASVFGASLYFAFWGVLFCLSAILLRRRILIAVTSYFAIVAFQFVLEETMNLPRTAELEWGIPLQLLHFVLFSVAIFLFSIRWKQELTSKEAWALFPALFIFYGFEYSMIESLKPDLAPWISLGFAAFIFILYAFARKILNKQMLASAPMIATFVAMVLFHSVYMELWPAHYSIELGLLALIALGLLKKFGVDTQKFWFAFLFLWIVVGIEYLSAIEARHTLKNGELTRYALLNLAFMGLIGYSYLSEKTSNASAWLLFFASLQALFGLDRIADIFADHPINSYLTSGLWGVFALLILGVAFHLKDKLFARCAVLILWLVSAKVLLVDLSASSPVVKIITLCGVGAILYASGLILKKFKEQEAL